MTPDRVLYVDPFGGLAGDMLCAALLDLGIQRGVFDLDVLRHELAPLELDGWKVSLESVRRGPLAARRFVVEAEEGHHHRHWPEIRERLERLAPGTRDRALAAFGLLAEAEARVHGIALDEVAFHEVGAIDSIVDIVGAAAGLARLGVARVQCGPPPVSGGQVHTAHGPLPLPAPATLDLLRGWPVRPGHPGHEQVTPTGAALVAALAEPGELPPMRLLATGHGAGTRDPDAYANVLRLILGDLRAGDSPAEVVVVSAQMDDLAGEHLPPLIEALLGAGALDAVAIPVLMKKGRAGLLVEALAEPGAASAVERALLRHGSTFGVRRHPASRRVLDRWHVRVETPWGPVRVKVGAMEGEILHAAPEFEDVRQAAAAAQVPTHRVHSAALHAWHALDAEHRDRRLPEDHR